MRGLMADPSGRIIPLPDPLELPRRPDRAGILHLHTRRAQGSGRYRPAYRGCRLPDPPPGGHCPGHHHQRT
ncbi:MAG: hypothetical protein M0C28_35090 [Candidatus Moduliflexus flocculans]|nr:hypothetical protein [Candidatus Moduliflexus flocculans]